MVEVSAYPLRFISLIFQKPGSPYDSESGIPKN